MVAPIRGTVAPRGDRGSRPVSTSPPSPPSSVPPYRHDGPVLVSVVVPTRNRCALLARALDAHAAQDYGNFEVILVDDGSDDGTPELLQTFASDHPNLRFTHLRNDPARGANPSRNRGIAASAGAIVALADDDSIPAPDWISKLVAAFDSPQVAAVAGEVEDPPPRNIYDLTFRGTHHVAGRVHATRLVGCNMAVRREFLDGALDEDRAGPSRDTTVSGRGDEEGLFLRIKAAGYEVHVARDAVVLHEHFYTRRSFYRQAFKGGGSSARLGYKYHLSPRWELLCLAAGWALAPVGLWLPPAWLGSGTAFGLFLAAVLYNEVARKRKTPLQTLRIFPTLMGYYHVRTAGYLRQWARFLRGVDRLERVRL